MLPDPESLGQACSLLVYVSYSEMSVAEVVVLEDKTVLLSRALYEPFTNCWCVQSV